MILSFTVFLPLYFPTVLHIFAKEAEFREVSGSPQDASPQLDDTVPSPRGEVWNCRSSLLQSPLSNNHKRCCNKTLHLNCPLFSGCQSALQTQIARYLFMLIKMSRFPRQRR